MPSHCLSMSYPFILIITSLKIQMIDTLSKFQIDVTKLSNCYSKESSLSSPTIDENAYSCMELTPLSSLIYADVVGRTHPITVTLSIISYILFTICVLHLLWISFTYFSIRFVFFQLNYIYPLTIKGVNPSKKHDLQLFPLIEICFFCLGLQYFTPW